MAGDSEADPGQRPLEFTPTWALATISCVFVILSIVVEHTLHRLGCYFHSTKRKALQAALQKMKDELMLVGFISLTLTILEDPVSRICIRSSLYTKWTPCKIESAYDHGVAEGSKKFFQWSRPSDVASAIMADSHGHGRKLLVSEASGKSFCPADYEPFMSQHGLHQLHIFIFVLAGVHVVYSCLTMALALAKVHSWRKWEVQAHEASSLDGMAELVITNVSYTRQSTFLKYHTSKPWSRSRCIVWVVCFFQQFHIPRADYLTLRLSFITAHNLPFKYNFHDYMIRSMEDEFETIVGISAWLWAFVVAFLLFNVQGVNLYFWSSFVPVGVILAIGMKLQHIVATLALENPGVGEGAGPFVGALLKPRDQLFWFNQPKLLLHVIHLVLFQNAFELATFLWHVWQFGFHSCLLEQNKVFAYVRLAIGLLVQLSCSFSTLPLYALVSQMGTNFKKAVVPMRVNRVLHVWHKDARKRLKLGSHAIPSDRSEMDSSSSISSRSGRGKLTLMEERTLRIKEVQKLNSKKLDKSETSSVSSDSGELSSPMSVIMEEGSLSPEDRRESTWASTMSTSPTAMTSQNVWDRRLRKSNSGRRKPLKTIINQVLQMNNSKEPGVTPPSTPGSELRRRVAPGDVADLQPLPIQIQISTSTTHCSTPKPQQP